MKLSHARQTDRTKLLSAVRINLLSALLESPSLFFSSDMSDIFPALLFPIRVTQPNLSQDGAYAIGSYNTSAFLSICPIYLIYIEPAPL